MNLDLFSPLTRRHLRNNAYFSPHHRLFYVATPKVACTSLKWWFAELLGVRDAIEQSSISNESDPELVIHDTLVHVAREYTGSNETGLIEALSSPDYFRFCVVRNPYTRIFSAWQSKWLLHEPLQANAYVDAEDKRTIESAADIRHAFEAFLQVLATVDDPSSYDVHVAPQVDLLDPEQISYQIIAHIENSSELVQALKSQVGHGICDPFSGVRANVSLLPYSAAWISEEAAELIRMIYALDFEVFGYSMSVPAGADALEDSALEVALRSIKLLRGRNARIGELVQRLSVAVQSPIECVERCERGAKQKDAQNFVLIAQIFLSELIDGQGQAYSESRSIRKTDTLDKQKKFIDMVFLQDLQHLVGLRFDISCVPAAIMLHSISMHYHDGAEIWHWDGSCDLFVNQADMLCLPDDQGVLILSLSDDPHCELALSQEVLARIHGGCFLRLELTASPLQDVLPGVLSRLQARPEPALPVAMRPQLPASAAGHLAELGELLKTVVERKNATIAAQMADLQVMQDRQNLLYEQLVRAEAQLDLLKQLVLPDAASRPERL
jgi:hypothetical protein